MVSTYWLDPKNVRDEISSSEFQRDKYLAPLKDMLRKYEGPGRDSTLGNDYLRENHFFEWVSLVLPQTLFQNPKLTVSSKRSRVAKWDAVAMESGLNRWVRDTDYKRHLERVGVDWCFVFGVSMVTVEKYGDFEDPKHRPRMIHLDPEQFGMDCLARAPETSRFMFHKCVDDKEALKRRAASEKGWDQKAVEALATMQDLQGVGRPKVEGAPNRNEVTYWEVWVPELNEDDDEEYHGKILTVGVTDSGTKSAFLREARPYYGPAWGPYTVWGAYTVPRSAWPMGPLQAHEGHVRELNLHAQANSLSAARRKTIFVYDETDKEAAAKILKAEDGAGVGIVGLQKDSKMETFQTPGVTEDALLYEQYKRGSLERISGLNDRAKGETAGGATATADAIAARGATARMGWLEQKLYEAAKRELRTVAWYYWHDDQIEDELTPEALAQLGLPPDAPVAFKGGNEGPFDDLELEIEPYSMQRTDEAGMQARAMQMFQLLTGIAPIIPQTPWIDWETLFDKFGKVMNWPELAEIVDTQMAAAVAGMLLQQQQAMAAQPQQKSEGPKFGGDRGKPPTASGGPRLARPAEYGQQAKMPGQSTGAKAGRAAQGAA